MEKKTAIFAMFSIIFIIVLILLGAIAIKNVGFKDINSKSLNTDIQENPRINMKSKNTIVEFMDFKCPYCKKLHNQTFSKIEKNYLINKKANYVVINASILGKDSIVGSRAAHALYLYYPKKYWEFHNRLFELQPNNEKKWITERIIDKELNNLNIPNKSLSKIKHEYKTKNSKAWKLANHDRQLYKKYKIDYVPSVYVNGKFVENPYDLTNLDRYMMK